ncbi:MAG: tetratricopeptide repeat protein, partial [Candidatus Aminicenantaceae bacterium]
VEKITTSSPEALKYYIDAGKYHRKGDYNQAIQLAKKAVAIDPEFAMAYLSMSTSYYNLNRYSEHKMYLKKALEFKDRVSERERYSIMGSFYWLSEETYDKAIEAYNKLVELYPEEKTPHINLAIIYRDLEEWEKSIERFEVLRKEDAKSIFIYSNLAIAYWYLNNYKKAEEVLKYYINNFSDNVILNGLLAYNYLFQGDYNRAIQEVDKAISLNPTIYRNLYIKGDIYHIKGDLIQAEREYQKLIETGEKVAQQEARGKLGALYLLQGKFGKSNNQLKMGVEVANELGEMGNKSNFHLSLAYGYLKLGKLEEALEECNKAWSCAVETESLNLQRNVLHLKGQAYIAMNELSEFQRTANELKKLSQKGLNRKVIRNYHHLMGLNELKRNNFSEAIKELKKAISFLSLQMSNSALFIDSLASAYYKAGDLEKALKEYERIISLTYGRLYYGDIYAKSFYMLGKINEERGNTAKAIEHYEKFLALWKDADPGIAEVEDARERVAGLKD